MARSLPAQTPAAAQSMSEGAQRGARPAPASGTSQQRTGGDDTPRSMGASRGGGESDDAGYSPAQIPVAAQAASEGAQGRARPEPASGPDQQTAGGDDTPRSAGATGRTADEANVERAPPDWSRAPNVSGRRGGGWHSPADDSVEEHRSLGGSIISRLDNGAFVGLIYELLVSLSSTWK